MLVSVVLPPEDAEMKQQKQQRQHIGCREGDVCFLLYKRAEQQHIHCDKRCHRYGMRKDQGVYIIQM